ncbi:ATP-binding protein [Thermoactinospora rubra]|uniref:ATP-binding protein n=1 Tax=Thermoactinospora rubra TaxID=1088767 RepID=UPI000A1035D4|nr:ATP-binding protein [Thermoactinospora rubra]
MTTPLASGVFWRAYTLSPVKAAVPAARTWVRQMLKRWDLAHFVERAELLVSELLTNAITHASANGASVGIVLTYGSGTLRLEVRDRNASKLPVPHEPVADAERGRGLRIVGVYADRWAVDITRDGKTVWCELDAPLQSEGHLP